MSKFIYTTRPNKTNFSVFYYSIVYHHYHHHQASSKNKMFSLNLIVIKVNRKERMNCANNSENSSPTTLLVLVGRWRHWSSFSFSPATLYNLWAPLEEEEDCVAHCHCPRSNCVAKRRYSNIRSDRFDAHRCSTSVWKREKGKGKHVRVQWWWCCWCQVSRSVGHTAVSGTAPTLLGCHYPKQPTPDSNDSSHSIRVFG